MLQWNTVFDGCLHTVGRFFLESINRPNARQDAVQDIHQHATRKQKGSDGQYRHDTDQLRQYGGKDAGLVGTKEVIPSKRQ